MRVYEKVRTYIDDNGLQPLAIARQAGISDSVFIAMLDGEATLYADDLRAICIALNVRPELFVEYKIA